MNNSKVYWITGAGSGIGKAIALALASDGHKVVASGRNEEKLEGLVAESESLSGSVVSMPCDVADAKQMQSLFQQTGIDSLDGIILSAGTCEYTTLPKFDLEMYKRVMDTNFYGVINCVSAAFPLLSEAGKRNTSAKPQIIGLGSMSSYLGFPRAQAYGASKAAMSYFLDSLRADLGKYFDITVVYPGFVETPLTDKNDFEMPFLMDSESAAKVITKKMKKRPLKIVFPLRLHIMLSILKFFSRLWYSHITPRMTRTEGSKI